MWPSDAVEQLLRGEVKGVALPGIVSRQEGDAPGLSVGFASPYRQKGVRLRGRAVVPFSSVSLIRDPYQVITDARCTAVPNLPVFDVLDEAWALASAAGLPCGVFGSVALALATGLPYCHEESDLDLVVKLGALDAVERFHDAVCALSRESGVAHRCGARASRWCGHQARGAFRRGKHRACKGFTGVCLMGKDEVRAPWIIDISSRSKGERNGC